MKPFIFIIALIGIAYPAAAQQGERQYFDQHWEPVQGSQGAAYYRTIEEKVPNHHYIVRDYFISGKRYSETECSRIKPDLYQEGKSVVYYENGNVRDEGTYHHDKRSGVHKFYYENGKPMKEVTYEHDIQHYHQFWSVSGEPQLVDGNGNIVEPAENGKGNNYLQLKHSKIVGAYAIENSDTIYTVVETIPEYHGGYAALSHDLTRQLVYPENARKQGIEGTVYISFIVDRNGKPRECEVVHGIDRECDKEAVVAVQNLKGWKAGQHNGKNVAVRFMIPVIFKLGS